MDRSGKSTLSPKADMRSKGKGPSPLRNEQLLARGRTSSDPAEQNRSNQSSRRERTVSDAAQYARNRRQSELMKELMPAGKGGASEHKFQLTTYSKATFCGVCSKFFWGFSRQGLKCTDCGFDCHKQCQQFAPACLGKHGSVASTELDGFLPARTGTWTVQITICSADGLARRSMFKTPDPFCLATTSSGQQFCTQSARKTLSPQWNYSDQIVVAPSEQLTLTVFDAKKYAIGSMDGFLGVCVIPANILLDTGSLGQGATGVVTFRLKKLREHDSVTGKLILKIDRMEPVPEVKQTMTAPIDIPGATKGGGLPRLVSESPLMLSTSPGSGWQKLLPEHIPDTPRKSLLPNQPLPPSCEIVPDSKGTVRVTWDDGGVTGRETGVSFSLAIVDERGRQHNIYTGHEPRHLAVGFAPGEQVRFCVRAFNFFGSSEYSVPSEKITLPAATQDAEDNRPHCPMFMAGLCFRGAQCPFSHGTGLQSADDVAAALMAASVIADPDIQMAAALAASMTDYSRPTFDPTGLPQYKREFHNKVSRLRAKVSAASSACSFSVSRHELFKSSFFEISRRKPSELKGQLQIQFLGEGGLDYGGLAREWFNLVSLEIFNPKLGMFEYISNDDYALTIDPNSAMELDHILYFQFVGRFMGLAVLHGHFVDANFTSVFCKRILAAQITISDLQEEDLSLHRSMLWILENDVSDVPDMTFSADYESFGEYKTHDLIPGGQGIEVTEVNKHKFVELMVAWRLSRGTEKQLRALLKGLHEIIPRSELQEFNERELQFLLCGTREVDIDDWKTNTIYEGCTAHTTVVQHFWQIIDEYSPGEKSSFLQFCTGSTRIPVEGFQSLQGSDGPRKFCIQLVDDLCRLPSAHTCFNRLDLPSYSTKEELQRQLRLAIDGAEGFGGD